MSKTIIYLFLSLLPLLNYSQCPPKGGSSKPSIQVIDSKKNRSIIPNHKASALQLSQLLMTGDDRNRFQDTGYIAITGYVRSVKFGGSELCNCYSNLNSDYDIHICISINLTDGPAKWIICEVNRYTRLLNPSLNFWFIKSMINKRVTMSGLLFWDGQHEDAATNTNPSGKNLWRSSCWELHPVFSIISNP